jgi:flagellar hook-associated protein 1 FlgK
MGTINSAFSLISQGLDADQSALSIVANNVANANTAGYTREIPNWQENQPIEINGVSYGEGVTETGATSVRDNVLEERLNQQQQLSSASGSRLTALNSVQALFTPDSGSSSSTAGDIGSDLTSFFSSFSSLEANPTDNALRQSVLSTAKTLAGDVSNAAASLNSQSSALDQEAAGVTSQVNSLTSAIAQLNQQIQSTSPTSDAGTLEDQRQQDLSQLSQLIGINQVTTENNGLSITTTSGQLLVSEGSSYQLTTGTVGGVTHFFVGSTDITSQLASGGGELGGYLTARDQDIPSVLSSLDQLAYSVTTQVNALNNSGTDADGTEGTGTNQAGVTGTGTTALYIFNQPTQAAGSAASMSVVMTDPNQIAAAGFGDGTGDNSNATAIANLGNQSIVSGQTPTDYYSNFVTTLGSTVSGVQTENTAQSASVTQLQTQNNALSSVSLDDEASSMTTLERSYQAASQVFSMLNTIMASALNLGEESTVS